VRRIGRRAFCFGMLAVPTTAAAALLRNHQEVVQALSRAAVWDRSEELRFVLEDSLEHPFYWWPRTLLSYPIQFQSPANLQHLCLTCAGTGKSNPIQFTEVERDSTGVRSATLHFFCDLPSGARREFILKSSASAVQTPMQVREIREENTIVLDAGPVKVRIPASQDIHGDAPGPITQISRGEKWIGSSILRIAGERITRITSSRTANGPLFISYELDFETEKGSHYVATVQCTGGMEFVRLRENMDGMQPGAHGEVVTSWTGFDPTHRQAPNHPFPLPDQVQSYDSYAWERIDQSGFDYDVRFGSSRPIYPTVLPKGELPFRLGIYQPAPGNSLIGTWANFWNQKCDDALGIFIDDIAGWQDHEYAYEVEAPTLEVRYFYEDNRFFWRWPLARGRRSTCISFYDHQSDKDAMHRLERDALGVVQDGLKYQVPYSFTSHALFLQNRYGTLDLNRVKDWVLEYPEGARQPPVIFEGGMIKDAAELERRVLTSPFTCTLSVTGTRQMDGHGPIPGRDIVNFSPVPTRRIQGWWVDGFNRLNASMSGRQRARLTATFLLMAYVQGSDDLIPLIPMLGGHPNFLADVKAAPPAMSFLFPEHPMASTWADMWQKCVELNTRYNTRPSVKAWDAHGGRWTEDLGTYIWAFLRPSMRSEFLLRMYDGVERFVTPQLAKIADWLVNALSAPFNGESEAGYKTLLEVDHGREWGVVGPGEGPVRVYPPIGAHSERRTPPRSLWYLGARLQRYAPLVAEHAMWAARRSSQDTETEPGDPPPWEDIMYRVPDNRGTNPHLQSRKYTGYGIVLRAAVGTSDEVSVQLQQIDEGPNYRWGWAAEGGCGVIYYFAAGKAYGFNGSEDVGDRRDQDTDFCTNFGVFKDGEFRAIGQNVLSRPMYDLEAGQFAEIVPRQSPTPYSTPEYVSRSILLAGKDYFVLYDEVLNESIVHRLSWFVRRGNELPAIHLVRGASPGNRETQRTDLETASSTGVWFDGVGDSMAVVSHRKDLTVTTSSYGCHVHAENFDDLVFRNSEAIHYSDARMLFDGTAGLIRQGAGGYEFAMFHGARIGVSGLIFSTDDSDLGIGGAILSDGTLRGEYYAPAPSAVTVSLPPKLSHARFFVDGNAIAGHLGLSGFEFKLNAGRHHWEVTDSLPVPISPHIERTENRAGGARIFIVPVASADHYRLEISRNNGTTWSSITMQNEPEVELSGLTNGEKVHVRAIALNAEHESLPGPEYPLYVSADPPPPPDGLHVELFDGSATMTWGEVLGVKEYRLYIRTKHDGEFQLLYHGRDRTYKDIRPGIRASVDIPGKKHDHTAVLVEYCVTSANANGEGAKSRIADTNPTSWRNWDPRPGESFRRVYSFEADSPPSPNLWPKYYPE
jgi:hypothetical protein